jgi:hypothetical protein
MVDIFSSSIMFKPLVVELALELLPYCLMFLYWDLYIWVWLGLEAQIFCVPLGDNFWRIIYVCLMFWCVLLSLSEGVAQ